MKEFSLLTGASSGIGLEIAKQLAKEKRNLILVGRNKEKIEELAFIFRRMNLIEVHPIIIDLSKIDSPKRIFDYTIEKNLNVVSLINNAGFGYAGEYIDSKLDEDTDMIHVNITSLVQLTKLFLPNMKKNKTGEILNIASTASFQPGPYMSLYYASKAFVLSYSEGISVELEKYGISVTAVCPGPTITEFAERANMDGSLLMKKGIAMSAEEVARIAIDAMKKKRVVKIAGFKNFLLAFTVRFLPRIFVRNTIKKLNDLRKK
jgi:uncharacterized protein